MSEYQQCDYCHHRFWPEDGHMCFTQIGNVPPRLGKSANLTSEEVRKIVREEIRAALQSTAGSAGAVHE